MGSQILQGLGLRPKWEVPDPLLHGPGVCEKASGGLLLRVGGSQVTQGRLLERLTEDLHREMHLSRVFPVPRQEGHALGGLKHYLC